MKARRGCKGKDAMYVRLNTPFYGPRSHRFLGGILPIMCRLLMGLWVSRQGLNYRLVYGIIILTTVGRSPSRGILTLETRHAQGQWHAKPPPRGSARPPVRRARVLRPRDLLQVKYEMLRRVHTEGWSVRQAAERFGFSRPAWYTAQHALAQAGLAGLLGHKRGPKAAHKLSEEVMRFVGALRRAEPERTLPEVILRIAERFAITVHVRSLQRALRRREKKRRGRR